MSVFRCPIDEVDIKVEQDVVSVLLLYTVWKVVYSYPLFTNNRVIPKFDFATFSHYWMINWNSITQNCNITDDTCRLETISAYEPVLYLMNHRNESAPGYHVNTFSKWQTSEITFIKYILSMMSQTHNPYRVQSV